MFVETYSLPKNCWRLPVGLMLAAMLLVLAACSGENRPFSRSQGPSGRTAPPIAIATMNGVPAPKVEMLGNFIQQAAAKRDIAVTLQEFGDSWKLSGNFVPQQDPDGTARLNYGWTLVDLKGQVIHQISGSELVGPADGDVWNAVSPDSLRRVAGFTAENLASRLAQLGFATQSAGLIPPSHAYARAGPNAEKELDYETLYGHRTALTQPPPLQQPVPAAPAVEHQVATATPQPGTASSPPQPTATPTAKKKSGKAIRGVTVTGVKGSPGNGNGELAAAMKKALAGAGWPVYDSPRPDALNIAGKVTLEKAAGTTQKVALAWTVTSPDGKDLGTIRQANKVPAGSLDKGWGQTAGYAAQAGAQGIFDLVGKLR